MKSEDLLKQLTLEEKALLLSGKNEWENWGNKRLDIPSITFSDGPHGLRRQEGAGDHLGLNASLEATCFPTAATVANSWDEQLGEKIGQALGQEANAQHVNVLLGPGMNMKRSPLCGRNFEYFSEDPYLAGKMAAAYIRGIQSENVYACPKHFAVNSREYRRMAMNAVVDERTLREIYLTAFEISIKEGKAKAIMSSYNEINGTYANENEHLLKEILRDEWGFDGIVVTDWGASNDHVAGVKVQSNVEMPNPGLDSVRLLVEAVHNHIITEAEVDRAVLPIIEAAVYFQKHKKNVEIEKKQHHELAKEAVIKSTVLLKNEDHILPLKSHTKVAVRGPFIEKPRYQGAGSSQVNATKVETISEEIKNYDLQVVEKVEEAEVVLYFFGLDEIAESEGADRYSMNISEKQIQELNQITSKNRNVVGILSAGSSITMPWISNVKGLLHGYLTGQAGASAILDLLTGKRNPSGKLNETYPYHYEDCPISNYANTEKRNLEYREGPFIGYRYYDTADISVQFPFGYGLSYTTFAYSNLMLSEDKVSFSITNTGDCEGAEIVQLYVGKNKSQIIRAKKELKGFAKIVLKAGESKQVEINFDDKTFRYFNTKSNKWEVEEGEYELYVGANIEDIRLERRINIAGTKPDISYELKDVPSYHTGKIKQVSDQEFELLYGAKLPAEKTGPLEINDAICQMKDARSKLCRSIYKILKKKMDKANESGVPNLNILFIYNMPFRAIAKMSGGMVSMEMAQSIVDIANGHFFNGIGKVIAGYFRNKSTNRKFSKRRENNEIME